MTRQQYRKSLREIDKRLSQLDKYQEKFMILRANAKNKNQLEIADRALSNLASEALLLFQRRVNFVKLFNKSASHLSGPPKDILGDLVDVQTV